MGFQPSYQSDGRVYAKYILQQKPNGKIAVLYHDGAGAETILEALEVVPAEIVVR